MPLASPRRTRIVAVLATMVTLIGSATVITAPASAATPSVSGTVTLPADAPREWLRDVMVRVLDAQGTEVATTVVNLTTGAYTTKLPRTGTYTVLFAPLNGLNCSGCADPVNLIPETWPDAWNADDGSVIDVQGSVTGIDATLDYGAIITGTISIADNRLPANAAAYTTVEAWELTTGIHHSVQADFTGDYVLSGLVPGQHILCVDTGAPSSAYVNPNVWVVPQCWDHELKAVHAEPIDTTEYDWEGVDFDLPTAPQMHDVVDLVGHPSYTPFADEIVWLVATGISTGYRLSWDPTNLVFAPLRNVTREQMAAFLYRFAGSPSYKAPTTSPFVDLKPSATFYKEICWLRAQGISQGWTTSRGREYRPGASITREQMAAFLYRFADVEGWKSPTRSPFSDVKTSATFYRQISWLADAGISTGWTAGSARQFRPAATVTREQMAAFLSRLDDLA